MKDDQNLPTFSTSRKPETMSESQSEKGSYAADDGSHLDDLRMPDIDGDDVDPDGPIHVDADGEPIDEGPTEQIDKEAFWVVFSTAFNLPGQLMRELQPLAIQPQEKQPARAASDATHSLLEIYYPSALMPQSETLAHLLVAAPFFIGKALVVREILRAMNAKPVKQPDSEKPQPKPQTQKPPQDATFEPIEYLPGHEPA